MSEEKRKRNYSPEYKANAVKLAQEKGNVALAARELKIGYSLIQSWIRESQFASIKGKGLQAALEEKAEMERLRKRNAELEEENEILKKATAYFAQDRLKRNTPGLKR
ncbi:MAG TPA: transposase [Rectinema sp.]|jgi:transposase|nr:transposase [Rectinema sp.]